MAERPLKPVWVLVYEGVDISADIAPFVVRVTYTDHAHGESDEISVEIEDRDHRWINGWYPTKGDRITLYLGYDGQPLMPCGDFELDDVEWTAPPDIVRLKGLASAITPALRTENTFAYEGQTLRQVAETVAGRHGLRVTGEIDDIRIERITQLKARDLAFLKTLAEEYGHVFSVRGDQLVFHRVADLEAAPPAISLDRGDISRISIRDKTRQVFAKAEVRYHNPVNREMLAHEVAAAAPVTGDTLKLTVRAENPAQAEAKAKAALAKANRTEAEGTIDMIGEPRLVGGANLTLTGCGRFDGTWAIARSTHTIERSKGYTTSIAIRGIAP
ncbi:MAG: contractile injection system protein, VgrG/Pvc8 family [Alphaproteobacteria bacterium]|nr:contractile injection system protein, VgrG/Pvc8 family [Alphaproteobacteria bacterium]